MLVVPGLSVVFGALLALMLRVMSPTSENTATLLLALIAAGGALATHFGGSASLAALLGGMLLKQLNLRLWSWPRQMGMACSVLTMLVLVLVCQHILLTLQQVERHATNLGASAFLHMLHSSVERGNNDARWLRERQGEEALLAEVIRQAAQRFRGGLAHMQRG